MTIGRQTKFWLPLVAWLVTQPQIGNAQLEVLHGDVLQRHFGGGVGVVTILISNRSDRALSLQAQMRLVQTSSATAIPLGVAPWKKLEALPGQTILESVSVIFPAVSAETRFLLQWLEGTNRVFGVTEVLVYPTNLLAQLKTLAGDEPLGVFEPGNELKPLLRTMAVEFQDLLEDGTDKFHGKLAIFGPFASKRQMRESLADDIRVLAKRGVAVVWLQSPPGPHAPLKPSFYTVRIGDGAVVVAQGEMVSRLSESPEAQLNLIQLAEAALRPALLDLPERQNTNQD